MIVPPQVTISGVILDTVVPMWSFAEGPVSPGIQFVVTNDVDKKLEGKKNPVTVDWDVKHVESGVNKRTKFRVKKLYLGKRIRVSPWEVQYELHDQRILFEEVRLSGRFNVYRPADDRLIIPGSQNTKLASFDTVSRFKFESHSLKIEKGGVPQHAEIDIVAADKAKPWRALDVLKWLLGQVTMPDDITSLAKISFEIGKGLPGVEFTEETFLEQRFPSLLSRFLTLERAGLWVDQEGKWQVIRKGENPLKGIPVGYYEGGGFPALEDMSRIRPVKVRVRFFREYEILLYFAEGGTVARNVPPSAIENVLPLTEDITVGGETYRAGTWVRVGQALALWNTVGWSNQSLTEPLLRKKVLNASLEDHARAPAQPFANPRDIARCAALRNHYRRTFRINPLLMQGIEDWSLRRVTGYDPVTGQAPVSPVWMDYATAPSGYTQNGADPDVQTHVENMPFPGIGKLDAGHTAPFRTQMINKKLGIFQVVAGKDLQGWTMSYLRSSITSPTRVTHTEVGLSVANIGLADSFEIAVMITARLSVPTDEKRFFALSSPALTQGYKSSGDVPTYDIFFPREPARFIWRDGVTKLDFVGPQLVVVDAEHANLPMLDKITKDLAIQYYYSMADKISGIFSKPGHDASKDKLQGYAQRMDVSLSRDGALETTFTVASAPTVPSLIELADPEVKRMVYKFMEQV